MSTMNVMKKIRKRYVDYSCGFPIVLMNASIVKIDGEWILDINYNELFKCVAFELAFKQTPLTGNEVRFVRDFFDLSTREFAKRFGVQHTAVLKWEKNKDQPARITWGIEKDMRLNILFELCKKPTSFHQGFEALAEIHADFEKQKKEPTIKFNLEKDNLKIAV